MTKTLKKSDESTTDLVDNETSIDPGTGKPYPPVRVDRFLVSPEELDWQTPAAPVPSDK
jgi:hypothetical protein